MNESVDESENRLRQLLRPSVESRGRYEAVGDEDVKMICANLDGVLMGETCVWWKGECNPKGYAQLKRDGKKITVGVLLFHNIVADIGENYGRDIGNKVVVRHKCIHQFGHSLCVNPKHLELGSAKDNTSDAIHRDKTIERPLSEEQVICIRERRESGETLQQIADDIGMSNPGVSRICTGKSYGDFGGPIVRAQSRQSSSTRAAVKLFNSGKSRIEVRQELGLSVAQTRSAYAEHSAIKHGSKRGVDVVSMDIPRRISDLVDQGKSQSFIHTELAGKRSKRALQNLIKLEMESRAPQGKVWNGKLHRYEISVPQRLSDLVDQGKDFEHIYADLQSHRTKGGLYHLYRKEMQSRAPHGKMWNGKKRKYINITQ